MGKRAIISALFIVLTGLAIFIFTNKLYFPELPIESVTPKEAIQKLKEANQKLAEISKDDHGTWYIMRNSEEVNKSIELLMSNNGWTLTQIEGNSLFFKKRNEVLLVSTQMWTNKYRLVKVPAYFTNDQKVDDH